MSKNVPKNRNSKFPLKLDLTVFPLVKRSSVTFLNDFFLRFKIFFVVLSEIKKIWIHLSFIKYLFKNAENFFLINQSKLTVCRRVRLFELIKNSEENFF